MDLLPQSDPSTAVRNTALAPVTCPENESVCIGEGKKLTEGNASRFLELAERLGRRLKQPQRVLTRVAGTRGGEQLRTGQVVGVLAIPGQTFEILPKIAGDDGSVRRALIHMIAVAHNVPLAEGELAALGSQRQSLLELVMALFVRRLATAVQRGLPRRYMEREEDLGLLRGRLNVVRQFTQLAVRTDVLACRFDELSENTPLNRVLKAAVSRLASIAGNAANQRRLAELAARLQFVGESPNPLREPVRLDRTNTAFHDLYHLARLILSGDWQTTTAGEAMGFTLLFPMNVLFEEFIGRSLQRVLGRQRVKLQPRELKALVDPFGSHLFELHPDVVIQTRNGGTPIILDTKWKKLKRHDANLGVKGPDVYQMLAYARRYGARRVILLYPWHKGLAPEPGIIETWSTAGAADKVVFDIAAVDVGEPASVAGVLHRIVERTSPLR